MELGVGRRRRRSDRRRIGGGDRRPRIDRPPQDIPRVVELAGHRVDRQHSVTGPPRSVHGRVVEHRARRIRPGVAGPRSEPRIRTMPRPVPFQDHRHLAEGARLGRAQQLLGRDPGDSVVERVRLGRGVAGVRIQDELLAGAAGTVRVRARAGDRVPAAVGVGVVPGRAVHGDRVQEVGRAGREPRPRLARQRRPRGDDHRGDLERLAVACGHDAAVRVDQSQPRVCGRAVEEAGVDRRIGRTAAAVVDEIARHRVPQRLSRPVAKLDSQGPVRARRRLAGPGEPADEMAVGQSARHAVGLAVIAARVRVAVRKGQHPRHMRLPAACQAGPRGPADEHPPRVRERPCGRGGLSRPHRSRTVEAREQGPGAGDDRQRQRRQEDGAALSATRAVPAGSAVPTARAVPDTPEYGGRRNAPRH